jgi:hypothetical protein
MKSKERPFSKSSFKSKGELKKKTAQNPGHSLLSDQTPEKAFFKAIASRPFRSTKRINFKVASCGECPEYPLLKNSGGP